MKNRKILAGMAVILSCAITAGGCGSVSSASKEESDDTKESTVLASAEENSNLAKTITEKVSFANMSQEEANSRILLNGKDTECTGEGAAYKAGVVTISKAGCYEITGMLEDGRIEVDAGKEDKVVLLLNGVEVTCSSYAPLVVWQAGETQVYLVEGTDNSFVDGSSYKAVDGTTDDDTPTAAIYSKDDIIFGGEGSLTVTANCNDGITGKDSVQFIGGSYEIEAVDDGIVGKDNVCIENGNFQISAGGDGVKSTKEENEEKGFVFIKAGNFDITAENDAFQAESYIRVSDGAFTIKTGGGCLQTTKEGGVTKQAKTSSEENTSSCKGLKAGVDITVEGGAFTMNCEDDAVHSNETMTIKGGAFDISSGDDGLHADYEVAVMDGTITIAQSYEGIEGEIITISGAKIDITASDDGINAAEHSSTTADTGENAMGTPEMGERADEAMERPQMGENTDKAMERPQMGERADEAMEPPEMGEKSGKAMERPEMGERADEAMERPQMGENADEAMERPQMGETTDKAEGMPGSQGTSNATLTITGGEIYINAGGDGLDSNGSIYMSGGQVTIDGPTNDGNGTLDYDKDFEMSGGTLIGAGSSGMLQNISESSTQAGLAVIFDSSQSAGTTVTVKNSDEKEILSYQPSKSFTAVIVSSGELEVGENYDIYLNDNLYKSIELSKISTTDGNTGRGSNRMDGMKNQEL